MSFRIETAAQRPQGLYADLGQILMEAANRPNTTQDCSQDLEDLARLTGELAHEIKNPLSTLKVNLQLVREQLTECTPQSQPLARALRKIAIIEEEANRLESILEGFLRYIGKPDLQWSTVDLNELVASVVDFFLPQAYSHSVTLRQGLHPGPLTVRVDSGMIKQVLLNLFLNAQQAMVQGGEMIVRTIKDGTDALVQVSDTGCGIEPDRLPHVFKPYYTSRPKGLGLGLSTAKKIAEAHGGSITVDSEIGKGTSFIVRLPLDRCADGHGST